MKILAPGTIQGKADLSKVTITGPKTLIEAPDKPSHSVLRLHADTITLLKEGDQLAGVVQLSGNVRYRITQKTDEGMRVVEGTAGRGYYVRSKQRIRLNDGVRATLTDSARLVGPAHFQGNEVEADMSEEDTRYRLNGDPASNRLDFAEREKRAPNAKTDHILAIKARNYETGEFRVGRDARFMGPKTMVEMDDSQERTRSRFQASVIEATFSTETHTLLRAVAKRVAHYEVERPSADGKTTQTITGSGDQASYDANDDDAILTGSVQAEITDPTTLLQPAHASADKIVAHRDKKTGAYSYRLTGAPNRTRLVFTPKPDKTGQPKPKPKPAVGEAPPTSFPLGEITAAEFRTATYDPGKSLAVMGAETTLTTADAEAKTSAEFRASRIVGGFGSDQLLSSLDATGNVRFHAERPAVAEELKNPPPQTVTGTAARARFARAEKTQDIFLDGPFQADVTAPGSLDGPGRVTGLAGDTLRLNLAASPYEFSIDSPKETAKIDFQPVQKPAEPDKTPAPKGKKGKGK